MSSFKIVSTSNTGWRVIQWVKSKSYAVEEYCPRGRGFNGTWKVRESLLNKKAALHYFKCVVSSERWRTACGYQGEKK